jgi:hypothetical protein
VLDDGEGHLQVAAGDPVSGEAPDETHRSPAMAGGVHILQRVQPGIGIAVQAGRIARLGHQGVGLEEAAQGRVIEAGVVVIQAQALLPPLAGEAAVGGESPISGKGRDGEESENIRNPSMLLLRCFLLP